jgi:hypothetical protein
MPMDAESRRLIDWMEKGETVLKPFSDFNVFAYFCCTLKNSMFYFTCYGHIRPATHITGPLFSELCMSKFC